MLWKRSRTLTNSSSKQVLMAENTSSLSSPTSKHLRPIISSFFSSPKFFTTVFSPKGGYSSSDQTTDSSTMSPTSILDTKPFSSFVNPFSKPIYEKKNHHPWEKKLDSGGIGLGIVDALNEELDPPSKHDTSRMVLFGSQLKIQIPVLQPNSVLSPSESPKSPADFGIKIKKDSQFGSANSGLDQVNNGSPPAKVFIGCLSASEMELSEDYTCVIAHGPNPKTTHIFDDCIVENCCGSLVGFSASFKKENGFSSVNSPSHSPAQNFLSFCYSCKKNLGQGNDIFMYRGEKAFCSHECRYQEMLLDEGMEK
ncbi:hypothetical protein MKW94_024260 [Papaver nudicaule]|uniref:FLZ-type domain-containing protein n=1 Tax=Papaver nudicaule TaxID=74823 RepID=A0AA42B5T0_PAPNU|nr:hypothetical protein [Papaver nudicaule]